MGKLFTAVLPDGTERFAASMSNDRAKLFYELTVLLEHKFVNCSSGIQNDQGEDEYWIDPQQFIAFFEIVWEANWLTEHENGLLNGWARYAAGMIENITLKPRIWIDRNGHELKVRRYLRPDEIDL